MAETKENIITQLISRYFGEKCFYDSENKSYGLASRQIHTLFATDDSLRSTNFSKGTAVRSHGGETPGEEPDSVYAVQFGQPDKMIAKLAHLCINKQPANKEEILGLISSVGIGLEKPSSGRTNA